MLSLLDLLLLITSAHGALAGPVRKFSNSTSSTSGYLQSSTASTLPTLAILSGSGADNVGYEAGTQLATPATSSSTTDQGQQTPTTILSMHETSSINGTSHNAPTSETPSSSSAAASPIKTATSSTGTTTLTLFTTVPSGYKAGITSPQSASSESVQRSPSRHHSSPSSSGPSNPSIPGLSPSQTFSSGNSASSTSLAEHPSSINTSPTGQSTATESITASSGGVGASSHAATTSNTQVSPTPASLPHPGSSDHSSSTRSTFTSAATTTTTEESAQVTSTAFPYPSLFTYSASPLDTSMTNSPPSGSQAASTADPVQPQPQTSAIAPTSSDSNDLRPSHPPPTHSGDLPPLVTESDLSTKTTSTTSSIIPGVTIVPVDPNMTTVTLTVTDPGWTTTLAGKTVTVTA